MTAELLLRIIATNIILFIVSAISFKINLDIFDIDLISYILMTEMALNFISIAVCFLWVVWI